MASVQPTHPNQPEPCSATQSAAEPTVDPTVEEPSIPSEGVLQQMLLALQADAQAVTDTDPAQLPLAEEEEEAFGEDDQTQTGQLIARAEAASKHADTQDKQSQTRLREQLAGRVFTFMERWCAFVAIIFWMYFSTKKGDIPSEVMIALLTTTTVSVIGLVGFVVQGLFRSRPIAQEGKDS